MAPVTLPPSFYNSFWSPDYRTGLEVLFKQLHQGVLEDEDVAEFIESQVKAHQALAATLLSPPIPSSSSSSQTSSSLQHTLLSLRGASSARGEAHNALAAELEQKVLAGFNQWKVRHEDRIRAAKDEYLTTKTGVVGVWEKDVQKLSGLRQTYLNKSRAADDSEDDAKFAPATASPVATVQSPPMDNYTSSPKPQSAALALKRSGTVADRINEKLRAASVSKSPTPQPYKPLMVDGKTLPAPPSPLRPHAILEDNGNGGIVQSPNSPKEDAFIPPSDPHGRPTFREVQEEGGGPAVPPKSHNKTSSISSANGDSYVSPILLSGLSLTSQALKELLRKLDTYLLTHPAPYSDASFASNSSSRSNAALASRQRGSIIGTYEKTFSGEEVVQWLKENVEGFGGDWDRCVEAATELYQMGHLSRIGVGRGFDPNYDTYFILKMVPSQSTNPLSAVGSPLSPATSTNIQTMLKNYIPSGLGGGNDEPPHIRLRREATKADEAYREAVRSVEEKRLEMEQRIERGLRVWERWERERLSVVKSVLKQYDEAIAKLPSRLSSLHDSTSLSVEAFNPEADLKALIEGNRTGPFRPQPHIYDSIETDVPDVNFGVDLRKWSGELGWKGMLKSPTRPKGAIPEVLQALLSTLHEVYTGLPEEERRRSWIYEVPLVETHTLRSAINSSRSGVEELSATIKRFNAPVIAGVIKLYLLELNPPVMGWEGWEDAKAVYPSVGADLQRDMTSAVTSVLGRLPGAHLYALDAVVKHFRDLVDSTKSAEPDNVYITKLALSLGRCVLRPQRETEVTIGDRTASLFLADLITTYHTVFPPLVDKKKKEAERVLPVRKRTALVDQRISRASFGSIGSNGLTEVQQQQVLEQHHATTHATPPKATPEASNPVTGVSALGLGAPVMEEPADTDDEDDKAKPRATAPVPVSTATSASAVPAPAPATVPSTTVHVAVPPAPVALADPVKPEAVSDETSRTVSPTPHSQSVYTTRSSSPTPRLDLDEDVTSPTASILDAMDQYAPSGDESAVGSGIAGLKRASSSEVSRLRGPRGARGPRPAPGRNVSHTMTPSLSSIPSHTTLATPPPAAAENEAGSERSGGVGVSGDYAPKRGKGIASAGAFGHKTRGSVSQAIAQFENRG